MRNKKERCPERSANCKATTKLISSRYFRNALTIGALAVVFVRNAYCAKGDQHSAGEKQNVVNTIRVLFDALRDEDLEKFHSVVSSNFYLFDNGIRFDGDTVMNVMKSLHSSGKRFEWNVSEPDVHLQGNSAWVAYVNSGMIIDGDLKSRQQWLESAFLDKRSGTWKIEFAQSTRVPPANPKSK